MACPLVVVSTSLAVVLDALDAATVRRWAVVARAAFAARRAELDELNVFPVEDSDTGTNLYLTFDAALDEVRTRRGGQESAEPASLVQECADLASASLVTARGNSGVIFSQLIGGFAEEVATRSVDRAGPEAVAAALARAAERARAAVSHPVEGTVLTVASATADVAVATAGPQARLGELSQACVRAGLDALCRTRSQLDVLARADVVDAGAAGFVLLLEALDRVVREATPRGTYAVDGLLRARTRRVAWGSVAAGAGARDGGAGSVDLSPHGEEGEQGDGGAPVPVTGPTGSGALGPTGSPGLAGSTGSTASAGHGPAVSASHEVMFLLDGSTQEAVQQMTTVLDGLGDSLIVVGGPQLWNVHVHTRDVGGAIEAGIAAGRPHRIRVTDLPPASGPAPPAPARDLGVVVCVAGPGIAGIVEQAGAVAVPSGPARHASAGELLEAARATDAREVIVLPNDADTLMSADAAASAGAQQGLSLHVVPATSTVQGIAALAVLSRDEPVGRAVVGMTGAAAATRQGAVTVADTAGLTSAGPCEVGDVLGIVGEDIDVVGRDHVAVATEVVSRLLTGGGELVTLLVGAEAPAGLAPQVARAVHALRRDVEVHELDGGQSEADLLIGVE